MNADRLLAFYERSADAPDAIVRFRRFILDLAVRGKLVEQDPNDVSPEKCLLAAQKRLQDQAKKTKRLRRIPSVPIMREEVQKCIPNGWLPARLNDTGLYINGLAFKPSDWKQTGLPIIRIQNLTDPSREFNYASGEFPDEVIVRDGDILVSWSATLEAFTWSRGKAVLNQHIFRVLSDEKLTAKSFLHLVLRHAVQDMADGKHAHGLVMTHINRGPFLAHIVLIPPLAEQYRIVAKVDELIVLCDRLEVARAEREATRDRLATASLARLTAPDPDPTVFQGHAAFALENLAPLTTRIDQTKALRQTILNLAVRGKLVEQDPNDEPASELLKQIAAEKARLVKAGEIGRGKSLPPISDDQTKLEIPNGWSWCRLGDLSKLVTSGSRDWAKYYSQEGAIFVRMGNLSKEHYRLRLDQIQRVKPPSDREGTRTRLEAGDLLISITGDVGMLGLIPENFGEAYINQHTAMVRPVDEMKGSYLAELFRSPFSQDQFNAPQRGIKNSFRLTDVTQFLVPLPPIAEQHRIVAKLDELMALCDRLEASLASGNDTRHQLLDALLHETLSLSEEKIGQDISTITQKTAGRTARIARSADRANAGRGIV